MGPGCNRGENRSSAGKTAPAKVEKLPLETEIGRITLTEQAENRLGIVFGSVAEKTVLRRRTFGGDVMIPTGKAVMVSAPFAGTITASNGHPIPVPGQMLELGTPIVRLEPLLTPERDVPTPAEQMQMANARATLVNALTIAEGDVQRSTAEVTAAQVTLDRARQLLADRAGSRRAVDDAEGIVNIAQSTLNAASERQQQIKRLIDELDKPASSRTAEPLDLTAPQSGVLRSLLARPGQAVTPGTPLFEVVDTSTMWVRVPVYVELLAKIATDSPAEVVSLGASGPGALPGNTPDSLQPSPGSLLAQPVAAPPSADPLSSTIDLYYSVNNQNQAFRPGQRVGMQLDLLGQQQGLTVPRQSVLYDIYGGTWVYVSVAPHTFERRRILISHIMGDDAVIAEGPPAGTQVVTAGAAELFGTEFGAGK